MAIKSNNALLPISMRVVEATRKYVWLFCCQFSGGIQVAIDVKQFIRGP